MNILKDLEGVNGRCALQQEVTPKFPHPYNFFPLHPVPSFTRPCVSYHHHCSRHTSDKKMYLEE